MGIDLAKLTQVAVAAASKAGVTATATITRPAPPPNPVSGVASGSAVLQTVPVVQAKARRTTQSREDGAWSTAHTALFLASRDATFTPQRGDLVAFAGRAGRLVVVDEYAPTGYVIGWTLGIGEEPRRG